MVEKESDHHDGETVLRTMILILGVIEAVTALAVVKMCWSINGPQQVKRNLFINFLSKHYITSYACPQENVYFYLFVYLHHQFLFQVVFLSFIT